MYLLGWDDNSVGTVLALQAESLNLIPEPWIWSESLNLIQKKLDVVACAYNLIAGEEETGRSLGFTGHLTS